MDQSVIASDRDLFDEAAYLEMYPDIARAIADGTELSAWNHYDKHGRKEGRLGSRFDPDFYLRAYPLARDEIQAGLAATPQEHYNRFGRNRGFLPHRKAPRPQNAAALPSPFGGFWPDQANALDIVAGKREIGQITERQAAMLRFWIQNGYIILENAIPEHLIGPANADLGKAYSGGFPDMWFECHSVARQNIHWQPEITPYPAKALDIHHFSPAIRDLVFAPAISEFLGLIFESKAYASQTLGFLRGSAQEGHQDSAYVPYTIPRQFAATWIALEDVKLGAGELFYWVGSHTLEDFVYAGAHKSVSEAQRTGDGSKPQGEVQEHVKSLEQRAKARGLERKVFAAKRGDVLVWHADLVHGGNPVSRSTTRKSIVTHYCPKRLAPLFAEQSGTKLYHYDGHVYTTSHYPNSDPVGLK